jgi:outer membrane protein OmpA-like peptidoglycan-associated protein
VVSVALSKPQVDQGKPIAFDQNETINLPLGAEGFIYLTSFAYVMEDNVSLWPISTNGHNKYRFYAKWKIKVDEKGNVTISLPEKEYEGQGDVSWTLVATPVQDEKFKAVGMDFELLDKSTKTSGWSGSFNVNGEIVGGGGTMSRSGTSVSPNVVGRSIRVNIVTPTPPPPEPHGEVTVLNQVSALMEIPFYFDEEGQKELKGKELDKLINLFTKGSGALSDPARDALVKGEEEIIIDGYASTTGIEAKNVFEYSEGRAQHVADLIKKKLGEKANIKRGEAHGSSQAKEKGPKREERKVIVKFWWRNY